MTDQLASTLRSKILRLLLLHWRSDVIAEEVHCHFTTVYRIRPAVEFELPNPTQVGFQCWVGLRGVNPTQSGWVRPSTQPSQLDELTRTRLQAYFLPNSLPNSLSKWSNSLSNFLPNSLPCSLPYFPPYFSLYSSSYSLPCSLPYSLPYSHHIPYYVPHYILYQSDQTLYQTFYQTFYYVSYHISHHIPHYVPHHIPYHVPYHIPYHIPIIFPTMFLIIFPTIFSTTLSTIFPTIFPSYSSLYFLSYFPPTFLSNFLPNWLQNWLQKKKLEKKRKSILFLVHSILYLVTKIEFEQLNLILNWARVERNQFNFNSNSDLSWVNFSQLNSTLTRRQIYIEYRRISSCTTFRSDLNFDSKMLFKRSFQSLKTF